MKFLGLGLALGILCFCLGSSYGSVCSDKAAMEAAQRRCFSKFGLEMDMSTQEIQNVVQKDPAFACRKPIEYKAGLRCAMTLAKTCLAEAGQSNDILPDVDRMIHGVTYLCNNIRSVDTTCVQTAQDGLRSCAMNKAMAIFSGSSNTDITYITCKAFEITVECLQSSLTGCAMRTKSILVRFTQHYLTPPACRSGSDSDVGYGFTTVAPMTTAQLVTVVPMLPHVSCYTPSSMQEGQRQCFENEGISIHLPQVNLRNGMQAKQSYLDAVLANNHDIHQLCSEVTRYQRAMGCAMEVARKCLPAGYKDYLPGTHNVQRMLSELCNNVDNVNQACVTSKASALFDCGYNKGVEHRSYDAKVLLCNAFKWNVACQKEVLPSCGCRTTALYVKIAKEYLNPPACSPITEADPVCIAGSDRFASSAPTQSVLSTFLLLAAIAACLSFWKL